MNQVPIDDDLEDRLCLALHQAAHAMTAAYRQLLDPLGLTYPQYTVLSALWRTDALSVKDLGDVLGTDYSTMSPLIKRLEDKALVRRTRSTTDQRQVLVQLTSEGKRLASSAETVQTDIRAAVGLPDRQRVQLTDDLRRLTERLRAFVG